MCRAQPAKYTLYNRGFSRIWSGQAGEPCAEKHRYKVPWECMVYLFE